MPVDQLAKITRYVGAGGAHPPLSKLGGKSWETMKSRARRAAQELAGELLNLYAERRRRSGPRVPGGQRLAARVRGPLPLARDARPGATRSRTSRPTWSAPRPMDRLICGDVGYGKTEVALRAAFKAADDGKQVLVLAPTTILAQQHYGTLRRAPARLPVHGRRRQPLPQRRGAARRSSPASTRAQVDILIGTHRLLGRDVRAEGPRPAGRRRGAALRRQAEGAAAPAQAARRRDRDERDADPAHAADVARRACATSA